MRVRLRFAFIIIVALLLAACSSSTEEPGSISELQETVEPLAETAQPLAETVQPALTEAAPTVEAVLSPSALSCEELPELGEMSVTVPENAVVVFQKTGGFAGVNEQTVVYSDGFIENDKGESFQSSPDVIRTLVSTAEDIGFFDLEGNYVPEDHCCDYFNYSLTIRDCEQANTVVTADEVPGAPSELMQIINTIQALIANTSA
jgi:hypothetical protein